MGLTPTPSASGPSAREQGISKAGNKHVRGLIVELAWLWRRWQPGSALSPWYQRRFGAGNKRARKVGIVARARKPLIALGRYLEQGEVPAGADTTDGKRRVSSTARRHAQAAALPGSGAAVGRGPTGKGRKPAAARSPPWEGAKRRRREPPLCRRVKLRRHRSFDGWALVRGVPGARGVSGTRCLGPWLVPHG